MLTVNELFSGIGAQRKALERLKIPYRIVGISEIDKHAVQAYESVFGKTRNYGDICKVEKLDYADLWTYSFPCQDISVAGIQRGINQNTRSGLLYQVQRLLETSELPKYLLLENVKNLVSSKFITQFNSWLDYLSELGYNNYWTILNAKDFGVPQNRERVFCLSIRKDIEKDYHFPKGKPLEIRLKDILESEVDEKFYLSQKIVERFKYNNSLDSIVIGSTLEDRTSYRHKDLGNNPDKQSKQIIEFPCIAASRGRNVENPSKNTVGFPTEQRLEINMQGMSNTLTTVQKDNYVVEMKPKLVGGIGEKDFGKQYRQGNRVYDSNSIAMAVLASPLGNAGGFSYLYQTGLRIRKLTPLECWRLMGFDDEDFKKAEASGVSNTQLYKQAGNSIVVNVLEGIFRELVSE